MRGTEEQIATAGPTAGPATIVREVGQAEGYVASVCFKTGPPRRLGIELEWTVHHAADPTRPVEPAALRAALGGHAPPTLDPASPHLALPGGGAVTVEPGGQLEISTPPACSLAALHQATEADIGYLSDRLARHRLTLGETGIDPHRPPRPVLETPRYAAMLRSYDRHGPAGRIMMYCTAGLQVCLDAGEPEQAGARWVALHALGPPLLAAFANARRLAGRDTGLASARMANWFDMDVRRTGPVWTPAGGRSSPARAWAAYALRAPLLCVRRAAGPWDAPPGVTFADWIGGALPRPPTLDDLDYHLSTLFPPVRPRGYLEVRYLDAQPPGEWLAPVAVLTALMADPATVAEATWRSAPAAGRWRQATRQGLADPPVAAAARAVLDLAVGRLDRTDLPAAARAAVADTVRRRLAAAEGRSR